MLVSETPRIFCSIDLKVQIANRFRSLALTYSCVYFASKLGNIDFAKYLVFRDVFSNKKFCYQLHCGLSGIS